MAKKILICGATGFIGRNMAEYFSGSGHYEVFGTYCRTRPWAHPAIKFIQADLTDKDAVSAAVNGMDIVIQAAATTSGAKDTINNPAYHVTDNAVMNSLIFRTAHEHKAEHVIFFSCTTMYQSSDVPAKETDFDANSGVPSAYFGVAWTKVYLEKMCEFYAKLGQTKFTAIRHSNIYGPYDKYDLEKSHVFGATVAKVMTAEEGGTVTVWGTGEEQRDLLYVSDLACFVEACLAKQNTPFELLNAGCGKAVSVNELVHKIIEHSGKKIYVRHDTGKPTIATKLCVDCTKAGRLLGWAPSVSLDEGIRKTIAWYKGCFKNMKHVLTGVTIALCLSASVAFGQSGEATPLTLAECYRLALKQSEAVAVSAEKIKEAEGTIIKSFSGILPSVSFQYSEDREDGAGAVLFSPKGTSESKFVFSQPLFSGFKEFAAISAGKATKRLRQEEKIRAEQLLLVDVSDAFHLFLGYQEDLSVLRTIREALKERIEELKKREAIGRSRPSEIASAEARLSRVEAEVELVLSQEAVARQLLEFLTGREVFSVADPGGPVVLPGNEEEYAEKSLRRPDVRAAEENFKLFRDNVVKARAGFFPSVTVDGNYYTKRPGGASEDNDWDTVLAVKVPIFNGADNIGQFQEARAQRRQAELKWQESKRLALLEARNAYAKLDKAISRLSALEKAVKAAEKNYEWQVADYTLNLVNNLDVLEALEELQSTRRDYISAKNDAKRSFWSLKVAAGESLDVSR